MFKKKTDKPKVKKVVKPVEEIPISAHAHTLEGEPMDFSLLAPLPVKIRMLMSLANSKQAFTAGQIYTAGVDLEPETAKSWLKSGVAIEVTEAEGPEETKEK